MEIRSEIFILVFYFHNEIGPSLYKFIEVFLLVLTFCIIVVLIYYVKIPAARSSGKILYSTVNPGAAAARREC